MRRGLVFVAVALVASALAPSAAAPRGTFTRHQYGTPGEPGARAYWMFTPPRMGRARVPLLVYLHGCSQTARDAALQTRFNDLAARERFIVVYPDQNVTAPQSYPLADGNGMGCWNWFHPDHQARGTGEPATIAAITRAVMRTHRIDPRRVYLEGTSAGGSMAVNVAAAYPDLYAAVAVIAACSYRTCTDVTGALTHQAMGERARAMPMFTAQGTADNLNPLPQSAGLVSSWLGLADLVDDELPNNSVSRVPSSVEHRSFDQTPNPGSGDPCVRAPNWTCPGGAAGFAEYPHTVMGFEDARGCSVLDVWWIHGMTHAYPGGDPRAGFTDPLGPKVTEAAWRFFEAHPRGRCA